MTDLIKADEAVLKTDKLGRMQTPAARREQLLDEFERSGLKCRPRCRPPCEKCLMPHRSKASGSKKSAYALTNHPVSGHQEPASQGRIKPASPFL